MSILIGVAILFAIVWMILVVGGVKLGPLRDGVRAWRLGLWWVLDWRRWSTAKIDKLIRLHITFRDGHDRGYVLYSDRVEILAYTWTRRGRLVVTYLDGKNPPATRVFDRLVLGAVSLGCESDGYNSHSYSHSREAAITDHMATVARYGG